MEVTQVSPTTNDNDTGLMLDNVKRINVGSGKLVVNDNGLVVGGTVIIDSDGLNSLNNFRSDTLFDDTNRTTSSTVYEDIPGATLTSFTLTREARILTYIRANAYHLDFNNDGLNYKIYFRLIDTFDNSVSDGINTGGDWAVDDIDFGSSSWSSHVTASEVTSISNDLYQAGTHTMKAQFKVDGGTGDLFELQIGYVILGI